MLEGVILLHNEKLNCALSDHPSYNHKLEFCNHYTTAKHERDLMERISFIEGSSILVT